MFTVKPRKLRLKATAHKKKILMENCHDTLIHRVSKRPGLLSHVGRQCKCQEYFEELTARVAIQFHCMKKIH